MNGNLVITMLAGQATSPDFAAILQNYWYAFIAVPCVLMVGFAARARRRSKTYKW